MSEWQSIWDKEAKAYYFWNPKTNETTWDNPLKKEAEDKEEKKEAAEKAADQKEEKKTDEDYYSSKEYYDWYMENMAQMQSVQATASFSKKQTNYAELAMNPRDMALERAKPKEKIQYTKKQIEAFKKKRKEKKIQSLIQRMGPDI
ncbi:hypothetical protein HK103_006546 [Boothiomyces macroporosus]|uniref:WW domain-containing protein n=1 Tax=Boothiomyces macroporosus TaxID=261099 RepID=A0AAD5UEB4_9FUNG|nr:hypothetical protein HK103_006546 [Boothiomyces macroporosus]